MHTFPARLRAFSLLAAAMLCSGAAVAAAQTTVYATVGAADYAYKPDTASDLRFQGDAVNFGGGVTYLFSSASRLKAGIDARAAGSPGARGGFHGGGSLQVAFVPHTNPFVPYFQIGGGFVSVTHTYPELPTSTPVRLTGGSFDLALGLNIRVSPRWAIRAIELGAQAGGRTGVSTVGFGALYTLPDRKTPHP